MQIIYQAISFINKDAGSRASQQMANVLASACSTDYTVSLLDISESLDESGRRIAKELMSISSREDCCNESQDDALIFLRQRGYIR